MFRRGDLLCIKDSANNFWKVGRKDPQRKPIGRNRREVVYLGCKQHLYYANEAKIQNKAASVNIIIWWKDGGCRSCSGGVEASLRATHTYHSGKVSEMGRCKYCSYFILDFASHFCTPQRWRNGCCIFKKLTFSAIFQTNCHSHSQN